MKSYASFLYNNIFLNKIFSAVLTLIPILFLIICFIVYRIRSNDVKWKYRTLFFFFLTLARIFQVFGHFLKKDSAVFLLNWFLVWIFLIIAVLFIFKELKLKRKKVIT
ncbi:MAG: hypothetical protein A3I43_04025 [Omnitrophica WOR_2 bacterium RIFCSPLOWO2_02_FULL_50_19]|nr:MAG: hypothetical protein A3I43_04025 [Omnitrophica WOR_2 bacterium RIFCSPLOWO2_02_FULL_50_19]